MRWVLIYNPVSGTARPQRRQQVEAAARALQHAGNEVEIVATTAAGSASAQTRDAVAAGTDVLFACGGDGTVHEVVQGLVSGGERTASLGIIPMGSENALARHLKLSLDPSKAALQQIRSQARSIPIGKITFGHQMRFFIVMAGAGPDGALVYSLLSGEKARLGRLAYSLHAARLFAMRSFRPFEVEYVEARSGAVRTARAVSAMAVRVRNLGGIFGGLTDRKASLEQDFLNLVILRPPGRAALPAWFAAGWLGLHRWNPLHLVVKAEQFSCRPLEEDKVDFQADGEWVGRIPMEVSLVPGALRLLVPG